MRQVKKLFFQDIVNLIEVVCVFYFRIENLYAVSMGSKKLIEMNVFIATHQKISSLATEVISCLNLLGEEIGNKSIGIC
jgi:hypothetical protein